LFLATAAINIDSGLTYPAFADISVKRAMIDSAQRIYLVADSSKIGERSFCALGGLDMIDVLITDDGISREQLKAFESADVEVMVAE
jgi:DeoR/GlpR family transcriptional regulator of sugar metabolism